MKLIYCMNCKDVVKLAKDKWRKCECGNSGGQYNSDNLTATIGGLVKVLGIANPFFQEPFSYLTKTGQEAFRLMSGYSKNDCWWGEFSGDLQIVRITSPNGPRIEMKIEEIPDEGKRKLTFINCDNIDYQVDNKRPEFIIVDSDQPKIEKPVISKSKTKRKKK